MFPTYSITISLPAPLGSAVGLVRIHKKATRDALMGEMKYHHQRRFPRHYEASAAARYHHMRRDPKYLAIKKKIFRGTRDHIKTNKSRRAMLANAQFTIGGNAAGPFGLTGRIRMRFPFPASFDNSSNKVTLAQMADELARFTPDEEREVAAGYGKRYTAIVGYLLSKSPRLKLKVGLFKNYNANTTP